MSEVRRKRRRRRRRRRTRKDGKGEEVHRMGFLLRGCKHLA